jgi:ABC-type dipeptide/oligopeptide/nickel transport system permease subunit
MKRFFKTNKFALVAAIILGILLLSSIFAPFISPYNPLHIDLDSIKEPPGTSHPFGTDNKGRDILSRVIYGARVSLSVGLLAGAISMAFGLFFGIVSGYFGGRIDRGIMILTDLTLAFPSLILAIGITVVLPPGIYTVLIALSAVGWASFARLVRGIVLSVKEIPYIEAARAIGSTRIRILINHILPQCIPVAMIAMGLKLGGFILLESALSFLGLGAQPPTPTWGSMISLNRIYIHSAPWMVIFPGLAIAVTTISFNMLGDALRDYLDPKSGQRVQ